MRDFKVGVPTPRHANSPSQEEHLALPDRAKSCSQQTSMEYTVQCTVYNVHVPAWLSPPQENLLTRQDGMGVGGRHMIFPSIGALARKIATMPRSKYS